VRQSSRVIRTRKNRVRQVRVEAGLSQRRLADAAGISRTTLIKLERGERTPTPSTILALSIALSCSPFDLAPEQPSEAA
jgi:putative transcriptional regulator